MSDNPVGMGGLLREIFGDANKTAEQLREERNLLRIRCERLAAERDALAARADELSRRVAELEAGAGWVSVNERLPAEGERVLVSVQPMDARLSATFREGVWFLPTRLRGQKVTHWQPMPPRPSARESQGEARFPRVPAEEGGTPDGDAG